MVNGKDVHRKCGSGVTVCEQTSDSMAYCPLLAMPMVSRS